MACVRVLSETIGMLPLRLYERVGEDGKRQARHLRLWRLLHHQPNAWQTSGDFIEMLQGHLCLRGNAYAEIVYGGLDVEQLIPRHPDRIEVRQLPNGRLRYYHRPDDGAPVRELSQDQMLHVRGFSGGGLVGMSPVAYAAEGLGVSLATQKFAARFFRNNARPGGVIEHPTSFRNDESRNRFRDDWQAAHSGANQHRTAVLEDGMKYHELGFQPNEAQFLETRQFQVTETCRIFRVPPHLVYDLSRATFSNIEQQSLEFVIYSLLFWLRKWQQCIGRDLIGPDDAERYFARFAVEGLLKGDVKARYEAYGSSIQNGWMTRNEVRILEDLNPADGLDEFLVPVNMTTPDRMGPVVQDAAARIANAELREIGKRLDRAEQDREGFDAWLMSFYHGPQRDYVAKVVAPLVSNASDAEMAVETLCDCDPWLHAESVSVRHGFCLRTRQDEVAQVLAQLIKGER